MNQLMIHKENKTKKRTDTHDTLKEELMITLSNHCISHCWIYIHVSAQ
uniref:Uncharacterized protein n=1 Tax=Setaria italica TaxID=4555 RepID=K3YFH4_SETIT